MNRYMLLLHVILVAVCSSYAGEARSQSETPGTASRSEEPSTATLPRSRGVNSDPSLYGVWIPETYMYGGSEYQIDDGLMIITPTYLIANAIYDLSEKKKSKPDANANYGTYWIKAPGQLVMNQAMQLHWRSDDAEEAALVEGDGTFFNRNVEEEIHYEVDGDTLIFRFQVPGEQSWIMKRAGGETCTPPSSGP